MRPETLADRRLRRADSVMETGAAISAVGAGVATVGERPIIGGIIFAVGSAVTAGALRVSERNLRAVVKQST